MHLHDARVDLFCAECRLDGNESWDLAELLSLGSYSASAPSWLVLAGSLGPWRCSPAPWEGAQPGCALSDQLQPWGKAAGQSILVLG